MDAKGRLTIPTRYREQILQSCNGEIVVTIDTEETCLSVSYTHLTLQTILLV